LARSFAEATLVGTLYAASRPKVVEAMLLELCCKPISFPLAFR